MIIIQARIPVQSERRNVAYQYIHEFVDQTRSEKGCMGCEAFVSLDDPDVIVIQQAWRAAEDLDEHASGAGLDTFLEALPLFVDGEVSTLRYDAAGDDAADALPDEQPAAAPAGVTLH
ncbi:MAG: putative quinol monooxygenase [Pseudomonadota bacterium]